MNADKYQPAHSIGVNLRNLRIKILDHADGGCGSVGGGT